MGIREDLGKGDKIVAYVLGPLPDLDPIKSMTLLHKLLQDIGLCED